MLGVVASSMITTTECSPGDSPGGTGMIMVSLPVVSTLVSIIFILLVPLMERRDDSCSGDGRQPVISRVLCHVSSSSSATRSSRRQCDISASQSRRSSQRTRSSVTDHAESMKESQRDPLRHCGIPSSLCFQIVREDVNRYPTQNEIQEFAKIDTQANAQPDGQYSLNLRVIVIRIPN